MSGKSSNHVALHEFIVGAFVLVIFLGLVLFTIVLSGNTVSQLLNGGEGRSKVDVEFKEVGGLRKHDYVLVRGVPVGQVADHELGEKGVLVHLDLKQKITLRESYSIRAVSSSLLGGMQLVVEEGEGDPVPAGTVLRGEPPANVMDNINELVTEIRTSLNEGGILTNIEVFVADLTELGQRLRNGEGTLGKLLSTNDTIYANLESTIANFEAISGRLEKGEGTLGKLLSSDSTLYDDLQSTVADLRSIADRVEKGEGTIGRLLSPDDTLYNDLTNTVANIRIISERLERGEGSLGKLLSADDSLYVDLSDTVANLKIITGRLEKGEGLLGQLMRDDGEIGTELTGLVKDGRDLLDDMRETSPVSTFSSIFFGAF